MRIIIETIPHDIQRYNTVGDWYTNRITGDVRISVSSLGNWKYEILVAIHELVEAFQCLQDGVLEESVDKFDKGHVKRDEEPGDEPDAPYSRQHCLATGIERILASTLDVDWKPYEEALEVLIIKREETEKDGIEHP